MEITKEKEKEKEKEKWVFYIIHNKGCTYAGVSPDPIRRLRKHNNEIASQH